MNDWQNPHAYQALAQMDRAGLMWEWLRRDPAYRAVSGSVPPVAAEAVDGIEVIKLSKPSRALRWGLHFRRRL